MPSSLFKKIYEFDENFAKLTGLNKAVDFFAVNAKLLGYLFIIGLIAYAGDVVNFSLNIDSENHAYGFGAKEGWATQGRWGMYLLNLLLLPDSVMPVIPMLIAIAGIAVGALFFVHTLSPYRSAADYFVAPIAMTCPVIYFAVYFTTLGYGLGIAFAVTCYGMYRLTHWTWSGTVVAAFCFCFGIGIYQAVLPLIGALFSLYLVSIVIQQNNVTLVMFFRRCMIFALSLMLAFLLYEALKELFLKYLGMEFDAGYMSGFLSFQPTWEYLSTSLSKTFAVGYDYYAGGQSYYLYDLVSLKILFFLTLAATLTGILFSKNTWPLRLLAMLALAAAVAAPLMMHVMNSGYMPPRTVLGVPQVLAALVFFAMLSPSKIVRGMTATLAVVCLFNFSVINNRYAFSDAMVWQADRDLSLSIQQRIAEVLPKISPNKDPHAVYPIELVGWIEYPETPIFVQREVVGASFYKWAAGDVERMERLFRTMGVYNYRAATQAEKISVVEEAKKMPEWPYPGSVDVINGVIVIKVSVYNPNQFLTMCRPPMDTDPVCIANAPH